MAATYTLKILTDFASAHTLRDYPGQCRRMHGHNWKLEVEVNASSLDEQGMAMDFKTIKRVCHTCCDPEECMEGLTHDALFMLPHCPRRQRIQSVQELTG